MTIDQRLDGAVGRSSLRVIEVDPQADPRWITLMNRLPTSVIYQHPAWLAVLEEAYGYKPLHLASEDATGQLHGILPLFSRRGLRTGYLCSSLFDSPTAGPLADNDQARAALIQAAIERTHSERDAQLQLKVPSRSLDGLVDDLIAVPMFETYELALPERPELLRLDSRIKRAVNKATRSGVQVRQAETLDDLRAWYELYLETMRRLVTVPRPYRFFELAWQRLHPAGLLQLLLAEQVEAGHSRLLAGFVFVQWGQTISYLFAGWRREEQALRPNDILHWRAMQEACTKGLRCYDFGNVPLGSQGLAQFKSKWGAKTKMLYRYTYPPVSQATSSASGQSKSAVRRLIRPLRRTLWQHMPLTAMELLGKWSYAFHYY